MIKEITHKGSKWFLLDESVIDLSGSQTQYLVDHDGQLYAVDEGGNERKVVNN